MIMSMYIQKMLNERYYLQDHNMLQHPTTHTHARTHAHTHTHTQTYTHTDIHTGEPYHKHLVYCLYFFSSCDQQRYLKSYRKHKFDKFSQFASIKGSRTNHK